MMMRATRAAVEQEISPAGGIALLRVTDKVDAQNDTQK